MNARINPLIAQTSFDSAAPSGSAAVVHQFAEAGEYMVRFIADDKTNLANVRLTVASDADRNPPEGVAIDFTNIQYPSKMGGTDGHDDLFIVRPKGHVAFVAASPGVKPYAVVAEPASGSKSATRREFDSRRLGPDDVFTVTIMRPGHYRVVNEHRKHVAVMTVAYPVIGDRPYRPPSPQEVEVTDSGFQPSTISLLPAQGVIFRIRTAARIKIDLERADDGPKDRPRRITLSPDAVRQAVARWRDQQKKQAKKS